MSLAEAVVSFITRGMMLHLFHYLGQGPEHRFCLWANISLGYTAYIVSQRGTTINNVAVMVVELMAIPVPIRLVSGSM